ncbi:glycosyltransferase [Oceanobacillus sojae]|uniref:glycosyltransferase n=1 Tax=Oceanobacillus sojae TaxID=582851 RepID=UPI0036257B89
MDSNRNLFYLANSFSENSGGRTLATFTRAKMLSDVADNSCILTFNYKRAYGEIYRAVREKRNIPSSIKFLNMYEFFAGEVIFNSNEEQKIKFNKDSRYNYEYVTEKNAYKVYSNNTQFCYVKLDQKGTCVYKDFFDEKMRKVRREAYDFYGNVRVIDYFDMLSKKLIRKTYYTEDQRMYLCTDYYRGTSTEKQCTTFDENGNVNKIFSNVEDMAKYWVASLNSKYPNSIFFVEDRKLDEVITENHYSNDEFKSVAVVHNTHFIKPYNFGDNVNKLNGSLLKDPSGYSAVVLLTKQQLKHVNNQFGLNTNLYHIPHVKLENNGSLLQKKDFHKIVVVSRFVEIKRIMDILHAFKIALEKNPKLKLELWGTGEEEKNYKEFIESQGLQNNVLIKGYTNAPHRVFQSAGLSIITSKYEGFGMTTLESMTNKTPVIAYDFNYGPREMIDNGLNGYIVENGNINELANQIILACEDKKSLKKMGVEAAKKASTFDVNKIKEKWIKLIQNVEHNYQKRIIEKPRKMVLLSEIEKITKVELEDKVKLNFNLKNIFSEGLSNEKYYLYITNYFDLDKIGNRYIELEVELSKDNFELLTGAMIVNRSVYDELKEMKPQFSLGISNNLQFNFVEVICEQLI